MTTKQQPLINRFNEALAKPRQRDYIAILMDSSGSMNVHRSKAVDLLQEQLAKVRALQADPDRDVYFSYYTFGTRSQVLRHRHAEPKTSPTLGNEYQPDGQTPLYDCLGDAIRDLGHFDVDDPSVDVSFLVILITDGQENHSSRYGVGDFTSWRSLSRISIDPIIYKLQAKGNWTFVLLGPRGTRQGIAKTLGIPPGNVDEWDARVASEYARTSASLVGSTVSYKTQRDAGVIKATSTYFTDLSGLTKTGVIKTLDDVTDQFKRFTVDREMQIQLFVPGKTGVPFEKGRTFYQLTKTEARVQSDKDIVIQDKVTKKLYSGPASDVRHYLGIPNGGSTVRLKPGNHAGWNLYIQSKSDNRILVRGTEVLYKK
jgi:hypothetical protein